MGQCSELSCSQLHAACASAAQQIAHDCGLDHGGTAVNTDTVTERPLAGCGELTVSTIGNLAVQVLALYRSLHQSMPQDVRGGISDELDRLISTTYTKFYDYLSGGPPHCWRQMYTDASILKFALLIHSYSTTASSGGDGQSLSNADIDTLIKPLDLALILAGGAGEKRGSTWIHQALTLLHEAWKHPLETGNNGDPRGNWQDQPCFPDQRPFTPPITSPVKRVQPIPMFEFQRYLDSSGLCPQPLIITHLLDDWPACTIRPWKCPNYLLSRTFEGRRLIPIEIGRSYVDADWDQAIMPFGDFLASKIINPSSNHEQTGYLAQHALFRQLPQLRDDISIPDYCYTAPPPHPDPSQRRSELEEPLVNAWLGPAGTITPLHTDPYHNLLTQVVGTKYVRLYAPVEGAKIQTRDNENGVSMHNTSAVDVGALEGWDGKPSQFQRSELAAVKSIPFVDCILEPGDTLYIPCGWWHYVRSLSVSFSVSFWWN